MAQVIVEKKEEAPAQPLPLEQTPEFRAALAKAIEDHVSSAIAKASEKPDGADFTIQKFAEMFAMSIADLTDQGTGRKRVAPEILKARAEAREKMKNLLIAAADARVLADARIKTAKTDAERNSAIAELAAATPTYTLRNKIYFDEILVQPYWIGSDHLARKQEVDWPDVPNEGMIPMNDCAREIYSAFIESIGSVMKVEGKWAEKDEPMSITPNGLVVRGAPTATQRRRGAVIGEGDAPTQGLRLKGRQQLGTLEQVHVLGTVAPPAEQRT